MSPTAQVQKHTCVLALALVSVWDIPSPNQMSMLRALGYSIAAIPLLPEL